MNINDIKGIGEKNIKLLKKLNINTIEDLLTYYPYRYNTYKIENINNVYDDISCVISGIIETNANVFYIKKNFNKLSFKMNANNVLINVVIYNRAFLKQKLGAGTIIYCIGKYNTNKNTFTCSDIRFNLTENEIEPVYHLIDGVTNNGLRKLINSAIMLNPKIDSYLPNYIIEEYNFIAKIDAMKKIHNPKSSKDIKEAKLHLIYEELFLFMFKINYLKLENERSSGIIHQFDSEKVKTLINNLPFKLTIDQLTSIKDIIDDLKSSKKMNRIVIGDVGSGKTIVAIIAIYINYLSGYQSSFMAPTEILAVQHYKNINNLLKDYDIVVELIIGSMTKKEKDNIKKRLLNNEIDILIGTHSLISDNVIFNNLGLVITDEQHRFGVKQRSNLQNKNVLSDSLYLSATPIPRTYALTLYGDLDVSLIKTKPVGRIPITTKVFKNSDIKEVLHKVLEEIKLGHQIYVIAPTIIDEEENNLTSVNILKEKFLMAFNNKLRIEIIHGKLKQNEKDGIMNDFKEGIVPILIATTVIEVGVDVKNASMIIIFNAERFGLATLHQLRGRVGRSDIESFCYLISDYNIERLKIMESSNDGFYIAEKDFSLRGQGDLFGINQSGDMNFKLANVKEDYKILMQTKKDSMEFISNGDYKNNEIYQNIIKNIQNLD